MSACASSDGVRVAEAPAAISNEHATPVLSRVPGWNKFMYRMSASVMPSMTAMSVLSAITTAALRLPATSAQSRLEMIMFTATACWLGDRLGVGLGVGLGVEVGVEVGVGLVVVLGSGLAAGLAVGLGVGLGVGLNPGLGVGLAVGLGVGLPGVGLGFVGQTVAAAAGQQQTAAGRAVVEAGRRITTHLQPS